MAKTYVGLALSSTMFSGDGLISRFALRAEEAKQLIGGEDVISCCNPSHQATIAALREKFGIEIPIPETAPKVTLEPGDLLIVLSARFSRRLSEGEKYSPEEVESAAFEFVAYRRHRKGWKAMFWKEDCSIWLEDPKDLREDFQGWTR